MKLCELKTYVVFKFFAMFTLYTVSGHYKYMFDFGIQVNKVWVHTK